MSARPDIPAWAMSTLVCPDTRAALTRSGDMLLGLNGSQVGRIEDGVVRIPVMADIDGIRHYQAIGGATFHERRHARLSMSALDTPLYRDHVERFFGSRSGLVVDIGGGDGRNALPFLAAGHERVVVVDAVADALLRFRDRLAAMDPAWPERCLYVEADARALPLASGVAERVLAVEALYYLNEEYPLGLREAVRLLAPNGRILVSERDFEGGLVMRAIYFGLRDMLRSAETGDLWEDGPAGPVRTRSFTEDQLVHLMEEAGLRVRSVEGTPLLSLIIGWLARTASTDTATDAEVTRLGEVLRDLARAGRARRCHVIVAEPVGTPHALRGRAP